MTIGFGMQDPVLNEPRHAWYQKQNHVRIPKIAESKKYLDGAYVDPEPPAPAVPVVVSPGTIVGTGEVDAVHSLTGTEVTGLPTPVITYQWKRDGTPIGGATSATYLTVADDGGTDLTCTVTATNSEGADSGTTPAKAIVAPGYAAEGGTESDEGDDHVHLYDSPGTFNFKVIRTVTVNYEVNGAGAGGSVASNNGCGGAGGAGERKTGSIELTPGDYVVKVGAGGLGSTALFTDGNDGQTSEFHTVVALGGGRGGSNNGTPGPARGGDGGCGGGGSGTGSGDTNPGLAIGTGTGNDGGSGHNEINSPWRAAAGGGGQGGAGGSAAITQAGNGGAPLASTIPGMTSEMIGAGGAGSVASGGTLGTPGAGGGQGAKWSVSDATDATGYSSGGGGGTAETSGTVIRRGGNGMSGIIGVWYPKAS